MEMLARLANLPGALPGACAQGLIWGIMAIGVYLTYRILDVADLTVDGSFGTCARSFYVGDVKKEDIHAKFEDGVLHVELPAPQQTKALPENPNLIEIE